ncbi:MAG: hypothetical protein AB1715_03600 [Acidobacteriota bacterium]
MKRLAIIWALSLFAPGLVIPGQLLVKLKGGYFYPANDAFRDIYGGGMAYCLEACTPVSKNIEIWVEVGYFSKAGKLSFTGETTRLQIIPAGGGVKYLFPGKKLRFYSGLGVSYYRFREANLLGTINWGRPGVVVKLGSCFKATEKTLIDLYLNYSYCKMKSADFAFNIGGLELGVGLGYEF